MKKSIAEYRKDIIKSLKSAGRYNKGLELQISSLASALRTLAMCNDEIDGLTCTTVVETTRYSSKTVPHPVFKVQKNAQDSITAQLKSLGLTAADLGDDALEDPLYDLTEKVKKEGNKKVILKRE